MSDDVYLHIDVESLVANPIRIRNFTRCRVIGYLYLDKNRYILRTLNRNNEESNREIIVVMRDACSVPAAPVPQPVQIFGEICATNMKCEESTDHQGINKINSKDNEINDWIITLKAKFVQTLAPCLVYHMNEIIYEINSLQASILDNGYCVTKMKLEKSATVNKVNTV